MSIDTRVETLVPTEVNAAMISERQHSVSSESSPIHPSTHPDDNNKMTIAALVVKRKSYKLWHKDRRCAGQIFQPTRMLTIHLLPVAPRHRWGAPTNASSAMTVHRPLSFAMRSNDDIDWPVHSLIPSFHDLRDLTLRRLPPTGPCSVIFGSVS